MNLPQLITHIKTVTFCIKGFLKVNVWICEWCIIVLISIHFQNINVNTGSRRLFSSQRFLQREYWISFVSIHKSEDTVNSLKPNFTMFFPYRISKTRPNSQNWVCMKTMLLPVESLLNVCVHVQLGVYRL